MAKPPPLSLVAKALLGALTQPPTVAALALALAQSMGEGAWSAWQESGADLYPFEGTNNFGAIHATRSFASAHANGGGFGMVAFLDHGQGPYVARMAVYPSLSAGASAFLSLVRSYVDLDNVAGANDYAAQLYVHGYFEGFHPNRTLLAARAAAYRNNAWSDDDVANIADYAALIGRHQAAAQAALDAAAGELGDPTAPTHGPPFAPLSLRLTPAQSYAPHTMEHARALLGNSAVNPPAGAISLADALAAPLGDGVWMFPDGPAPVARAVAEELAGAAVVVGAAIGLAASAAILRWRPEWVPRFGVRA